MQRLLSFIFYVLCSTTAFSQSDDIIGIWLTEDKSAHVEIYKTNQIYYGKIVWLKEPNNPKTGKPWLDEKNQDGVKKSQTLMGSLVLWGFKYEDDAYTNGKVYDSRDGKVYTGKLWLTDQKTLKMRGYIGFLYSTETWTRVK